jgi:hypothetical protein
VASSSSDPDPGPPAAQDAAPAAHDAAPAAHRRCRCGYERDHLMVSAELKYSFWGWFWLTLVGASANPVRAVWRCRVCGDAVGETDDPALLKTLRDR